MVDGKYLRGRNFKSGKRTHIPNEACDETAVFHCKKFFRYKDTDYFRIDGSVSVERRMAAVKQFNKADNIRAR